MDEQLKTLIQMCYLAKQASDSAKEKYDKIREEVIRTMESYHIKKAVSGDITAVLTSGDRENFNKDMFKKAYPELYKLYKYYTPTQTLKMTDKSDKKKK